MAGTVGENKVPIKICVIPVAKEILFRVMNYKINRLEDPKLKNEDAMVKNVVENIDDIIKKEAIIDGTNIPNYHVQFSPKVFSLHTCNDNWLHISSRLVQAAADGY